MNMVEKNCKACNDLIIVRLADHKRGWGNFCDKSCSAAYKCGQRPSDVNKFHAKFSSWTKDRYEYLTEKYGKDLGRIPKAKPILDENNKLVKVKKKKRKVKNKSITYYDDLRHKEILDDCEQGWDSHKIWTE